ncbi:sensor histidine kinase [Pseudoxanthomonas kalamensis]|uniref:sensor histidine kinase n=1 Tax=Pseudoxanthomonas kalamensis TaxID=289483 RepID=UPI001390F0D9|nr:sensor histidine kinase [Pseudoxanthomonas kalamensis]
MNSTGLLERWFPLAPDSSAAFRKMHGKSPWFDMIHLLWTAWVFVTPVFSPVGYDRRWWLLTLLSYPLFLWLYTKILTVSRRAVHGYALCIVALGLGLMPWYPSGLTYFVFGCVLLPHSERLRSLWTYLIVLLLLDALVLAEGLWLGYPWPAMVPILVVTLVVGIVSYVEYDVARKDAALKLSHDEVRRLAALAERERIGRDLHDLLGHTLSLVALKSELAGKLLSSDPRAARGEIDEVARVARDALSQVRRAVSGIRAAGLAAELASARLLLETDGVHLDYELDPVNLPPELETALALCVREAVTNIQRHARAGRATVTLRLSAGQVALAISDDGRGGALEPGNGLSGMRERIEALGGTLTVESVPGRGTRLQAIVPLAHAEAALTEPQTLPQP